MTGPKTGDAVYEAAEEPLTATELAEVDKCVQRVLGHRSLSGDPRITSDSQ